MKLKKIIPVVLAVIILIAVAVTIVVKNNKPAVDLSTALVYDAKDYATDYKLSSVDGDAINRYDCKYTFDDNGNVSKVEYTSETETGDADFEEDYFVTKSTGKLNYTYDENGRVLKIVDSFVYEGEDKKYTTETNYSYDENGNCTQYTKKSDDFHEENFYTYDNKGNCIKKEHRNYDKIEDEPTVDITEKQYDSNGNCIKDETIFNYKQQGEFTVSNVWKYDSKGNCIYCEQDEDGSKSSVTYTYDSKGNNVSKVTEYEDEKTEINRTFDGDNRCVKEEIQRGDDISVTTFEYDDKGNCIKQICEEKEDGKTVSSTETILYTYDENGNCIKMQYTLDGKEYSESEISESEYDSENRLVKEEVVFENEDIGKNVNVYTWKYDKIGRCVERTLAGDKFVNVYDDNGNLVKEIQSSDNSEYKSEVIRGYQKLNKTICVIGDEINDNTIVMSAVSCKADGTAKQPLVQVGDLIQGVDYNVSYYNNVKPGTAQAVITFTEKEFDMGINSDIYDAYFNKDEEFYSEEPQVYDKIVINYEIQE